MQKIETALPGVLIIEPQVFGDHRGWFMETWSQAKFEALGLSVRFVQDNHSFSAQKGTLRGLHFQKSPKAQAKLLRCSRGAILDVAVDLRRASTNYCKWVSVALSAENKRQIFIPKGFGHGFVTLTDDVEVQYKVDELYDPACDRSIRYDDPAIGVDWGMTHPILSKKDLDAPLLKDSDCDF